MLEYVRTQKVYKSVLLLSRLTPSRIYAHRSRIEPAVISAGYQLMPEDARDFGERVGRMVSSGLNVARRLNPGWVGVARLSSTHTLAI